MPIQPKIIKVLITGTRGSGKSSIICRFIYNSTDGCSQEENSFFRSNLIALDNLKITFLLKEIKVLPTSENTAGFVLTLDPTRETDIRELPYLLDNIGKRKIVIALNKSDLKYISSFWVEDVKKVVGDSIPVVSVSAKTGENIDKLFLELAKLVNK